MQGLSDQCRESSWTSLVQLPPTSYPLRSEELFFYQRRQFSGFPGGNHFGCRSPLVHFLHPSVSEHDGLAMQCKAYTTTVGSQWAHILTNFCSTWYLLMMMNMTRKLSRSRKIEKLNFSIIFFLNETSQVSEESSVVVTDCKRCKFC